LCRNLRPEMVESMADTREMTMDDYLAMARRRLKVVVVPLLIAPIAGFLVSYGFTPRYTSQAVVQVQSPKVPSSFVTPVITDDFTQRVNNLTQRVLSTKNLTTVINSLGKDKPADEAKLMEDIRTNLQVTPVMTAMSEAGLAAKKKATGTDEPVPGVNVIYFDSKPERAQKVCNAIAELMITENLSNREDTATQTTTFLDAQVNDAQEKLQAKAQEMADFKKKNAGKLPGDLENNLRLLASENSQLDATTQNLNRAQQDKTYAESMLNQQVGAWKASLSSTNPQTLEQQLTALQTLLLQLQARYTDDYPDVVKTKADIAKVQGRLDEMNKQTASPSATSDKASANEPPEIRQLRVQIHQYQEAIAQYANDQKRLQASISELQSRTQMSPDIEQQWDNIIRDNDSAQKFYQDLLAKKSSADLGKQMESHAEGEQLSIGQSATKSETPAFPNRILFAAGGLGASLGLGLLIAIWLEFSDKSIRTERDAAIAMDLPLLISVPWVGAQEPGPAYGNGNGNGRRRFWGRTPDKDEEKVGV
jgi:uncharacterized protein involved in exopolysaccharide biosynthesis